jgi:hypothetical protein
MSLSDSEASLRHLEAVATLAQRLHQRAIAVLEYRYDFLAFGSWRLVAGSRHRRIRLTWDGKESLLSSSTSAFQGSGSSPAWRGGESLHLESRDLATFYSAVEDAVVSGLNDGGA